MCIRDRKNFLKLLEETIIGEDAEQSGTLYEAGSPDWHREL